MTKLRYPNLSTFFTGGALAAAFAPVFFVPALFVLSIFAYKIRQEISWKGAARYGMWFGFGFFTFSIYWMAIGVSVYIKDFWWALPFALFGLPSVLAIFIAVGAGVSWHFRNSRYYVMALSVIWVFLEWVRSWILTGLPWNLLGYSLTFSDELMQLGSIFGIYGMSFIVIYIAAGAIDVLDDKKRNLYFIIFLIAVISSLSFGTWRLNKYPTSFTETKIRIVQPDIAQSDKWDINTFWGHLDRHVELSRINTGFKPDIVVWSEAAVTAPYHILQVKERVRSALMSDDAILITGGVSEKSFDTKHEIYSAMYGINREGNVLFEYHKAHLVPFGEYIPFSSVLPIKKFTPGLQDYTEGKRGEEVELKLKSLGLKIKPIICYEAIFPSEVHTVGTDVIINITNDTWYGNSSGPYQHFQMARMRAVENGVPLIRAANSGISAIIDPLGRVVSATKLGHRTVLDGFLPMKIKDK